jgi:hypothetical protein
MILTLELFEIVQLAATRETGSGLPARGIR